MSEKIRVVCPVCHTWFYREPGTRTKYDKEQCKKIGQSIIAGRKRRQAHKDT
jgi:hypothetical protein